MATQPITPQPNTGAEAGASWNVRYISADGFDCQLTLRGETGGDVLTRSAAALAWLSEHGAQPTRLPAGSAPSLAAEPVRVPVLDDGSPDPSWCPVHSVAMTRREANGEVWFSHKNGDGFCKGKAPKK